MKRAAAILSYIHNTQINRLHTVICNTSAIMQAHFSRTVDKITQESGIWVAKFLIEDDSGSKLEVIISNEVHKVHNGRH